MFPNINLKYTNKTSMKKKKSLINRDVKFEDDAAYNCETVENKRKTINLPVLPQQRKDDNI